MTADEQNLVVTRLYWPVQKVLGTLRRPPGAIHETKGQAVPRAKSADFWRKGVTFGPKLTSLLSRLVDKRSRRINQLGAFSP